MPPTAAVDAADFQRVLSRNLALPLSVGVISAAVFVGLMVYVLSLLNWADHTQRVISNVNQLTTLTANLETGVRGFLLTNTDSFLEPYNVGKPKLGAEMATLRAMVQDNQAQLDRLDRLRALQVEWDAYADEVIRLRRSGGDFAPLVQAEGGKQLIDAMRRELSAFLDVEQGLLKDRNDEARRTTSMAVALYVLLILGMSGLIAFFGRRQMRTLSTTYGNALHEQTASAAVLAEQAWVRSGQARLGERIVGQLTLPVLGRNALDFIADYLRVVVAVLYVRNEVGQLERAATHGFDSANERAPQSIGAGEGLVGQVMLDGLLKHVPNLKSDYFHVTSSLGEAAPAAVVLAPVVHEGNINGVLELGFMHAVSERELTLLGLVGSALGGAVSAAQYRRRLQDTLEQTHQLNEELQAQQEELRSANEELEEQSRVLVESQTNLEHQQVELEQTNAHLAEQAMTLDRRNEALKDAQTTLQQRADELRRASRYKSEFLANMSHELRTPLNSSLILAKLLADNKTGNLSSEQIKFANTIYAAGNDLLNLVNDILDLSKVEAGRLDLAPHELPLEHLLQAMRALFEPLARDKGLAFDASALPGAPASIFTDRQRLEQILKNLLSNAIKFTDQGQVSLTVAAAPGARVAFAVTDTGIGIAADQHGTVFEAFRQADGTINRRYGGTGLGLSISQALAGLLGGAVGLESEPGRGSRFTLELPAHWTPALQAPAQAPMALPAPPAVQAPAQTPFGAPPSLAEAPPPASKLPVFPDDREQLAAGEHPVLVVEDDPQFAGILYDLAHEMGFRCLVAHGAAEGFELAQRLRPRAMLLDVRLPDGSGLGLLQQLKEHPQTRHVPVHVVAADDVSDVALPMGAVGVAVKPKTREELRAIFSRLEALGARKFKRVLLVEDDARQRDSVVQLIGDEGIEIVAVERGEQALALLREHVFDCMIIDLKLPDMDGSELLERMTHETICSFPPVIVYTGRSLTRDEEASLNRYSRSIIIKGARSPERLLDEVTLFLHSVESQLSAERQRMLQAARSRDKVFEGRRLLLVDDDVRNIFALTAALEQKGLKVEVARNGFEALRQLEDVPDIELVLMDVMMPGMDGLEATRRMRADPRWRKLPVIAVTAKAMKDDQEQCRSAGANDYLAKPIDLDRLFSLLRVWLPSIGRL